MTSASSGPETVGIIGAGNVGAALGRALAAAGGYDLIYGTRSAESPDDGLLDLADETGARVDLPRATAEEATVVVLAVPGTAVVDMAGTLDPVLDGTPVVDCTNGPTPEGFRSVGEAVAATVPEAPVAKAFNTIGANRMGTPEFDDGIASMFVCGADRAVAAATDLAEALGFDVVDAGDITAARHLESIAGAWIGLSQTHGRDIGFRLLGTSGSRN